MQMWVRYGGLYFGNHSCSVKAATHLAILQLACLLLDLLTDAIVSLEHGCAQQL